MKRRGFLKGLMALLPAAAIAPKVVDAEISELEKRALLNEAYPMRSVVTHYEWDQGFVVNEDFAEEFERRRVELEMNPPVSIRTDPNTGEQFVRTIPNGRWVGATKWGEGVQRDLEDVFWNRGKK